MDKSILEFDLALMAKGLGIDEDAAERLLRHGPTFCRIMTERIKKELDLLPAYEISTNTLKKGQGQYFPVRVVSKNKLYFSPSHMQGKGRAYDEKAARDFINGMVGFFVCELVGSHLVSVRLVTSGAVLQHIDAGRMPKGCVSRDHFHDWMAGKVVTGG